MKVRSSFIACLVLATACGGSERAKAAAADSATPAAASAPSDVAGVTQLAIGGRYETQPGTIVCPQPGPLQQLLDAAQRGDSTAFMKTLGDGRCSPVNAAATVHVAEQTKNVARITRAGDPATYWTYVDKLSPR